jgi:hypothetical protein
MTVPRGERRSNRRAHRSRLWWVRRFLPSWSCEFDSRHPLKATSLVKAAFAMPPSGFKRAHWARTPTWALTFRVIDRPSEPQLSSWSCELDSGHTHDGSIPRGCFERSRRLRRSHTLRFSGQIRATLPVLPALRLIGGIQGAVGEELVACYHEEFARSTFSEQLRALSSRCGPVRPTTL